MILRTNPPEIIDCFLWTCSRLHAPLRAYAERPWVHLSAGNVLLQFRNLHTLVIDRLGMDPEPSLNEDVERPLGRAAPAGDGSVKRLVYLMQSLPFENSIPPDRITHFGWCVLLGWVDDSRRTEETIDPPHRLEAIDLISELPLDPRVPLLWNVAHPTLLAHTLVQTMLGGPVFDEVSEEFVRLWSTHKNPRSQLAMRRVLNRLPDSSRLQIVSRILRTE